MISSKNSSDQIMIYSFQQVFQQSSEEHVPLEIFRGKEDPTTFFKDQKRKIDFVLVYEEDKKDVHIELPQELEGTDIGIAAAAPAFK